MSIRVTVAALGLAVAAVLAGGASATAGTDSTTRGKSVCIFAYEIDHTEIPDDQTIIFHMRNHKAWKNVLTNDCVGLKTGTRGFTYSPTDSASDQICSNLQTIRVNDTGQVCMLGEFTPYEIPPKAP